MADPLMATIDLHYRNPSSGFQPCKYQKRSPIKKKLQIKRFSQQGEISYQYSVENTRSIPFGRLRSCAEKIIAKNAKQVKIEPFLYLRTLQTGSGESHPLLFPSCLKLQPHFAPLKPHGTGVVPYEKEKTKLRRNFALTKGVSCLFERGFTSLCVVTLNMSF